MDWFRVYHGIATDPKLHAASRVAKVSRGLMLGAWIAVLEQASSADNRGDVSGITAETLAFLSDSKPSVAARILVAMSSCGLINGGRVAAWSRRQRNSDDAASRKRAQRESAVSRNETDPNGIERIGHAENGEATTLETNETGVQCHGTNPPRTEQNREEQKQQEKEGSKDLSPKPPLPAEPDRATAPECPPSASESDCATGSVVDIRDVLQQGGGDGGARSTTGAAEPMTTDPQDQEAPDAPPGQGQDAQPDLLGHLTTGETGDAHQRALKQPAQKPFVVKPDPSPPSSKTIPAHVVVEAYARWNEMAREIGLPQAQLLTDKRRKALAKRLAECGGLPGWDAALEKVKASNFLRGASASGWCADIDFVLQQSSFVKLIEGSYDNRESQQPEKVSDVTRALTKLAANGWFDS